MPALKIFTNLPRSKIPSDFFKNFIPILASSVNKPIDSFALTISTDCFQSVNGDEKTPSVIASLESIGNVGPNENKVIVANITDYIQKQLGVDSNRIFLTFYDVQPYNVGKGGKTRG